MSTYFSPFLYLLISFRFIYLEDFHDVIWKKKKNLIRQWLNIHFLVPENVGRMSKENLGGKTKAYRSNDVLLLKGSRGSSTRDRNVHRTGLQGKVRNRPGSIANSEIETRVRSLKRNNFFASPVHYLFISVINFYNQFIIHNCASCVMGIMGVLKWFRK